MIFCLLDISDTNVRAKPKGSEKSIFLKRHSEPKTTTAVENSGICNGETSAGGGFKFNFNINSPENETVTSEELLEEEDPAAVEKFKFVRSDNSFRFNFSNQ